MNNNQDKETFSYTYSAKEQEELKRIRKKYSPPEENKMEQLRRLDRSVYEKGTMWALVVGIIGALIMGGGMSVVMVLESYFVVGIIVGVIGMAMAALAYPLYNHIVKKEREKIAPEILRLTDELMK